MSPQMKDGPLSVVEAASTLVSASVLAAEVPQLFTDCTLTLPLVKRLGLTATVIALVVEVPVRPVGKIQL